MVERPDPHWYVVKLRGRACAAFVYVQDAYGYIRSDYARCWMPLPAGWADEYRGRGIEVRERADEPGKFEHPLYSEADYSIHDRTKDDRRVVGMTSHHNAILEAINRG